MDRRTPTFEYETIDVPGAVATAPQGINANGDISGRYTAAGRTHGFIRQDGVITPINYHTADNSVVADYTDARGIGPNGTVVGTYANIGEEASAFHGYRRTPTARSTACTTRATSTRSRNAFCPMAPSSAAGTTTT